MRARIGVALVASLVVFFFAACGGRSGSAPAPDAGAAEADGPGVDPAEVDRLRALGYVGVGAALAPDEQVGVLVHDRVRAQPGLNLFTNAHFCSAQLMDMDGKILHSWSHEPCFRWGNAILAPNGDLLVMGRLPHEDDPEAAREARYLMRMDWDGKILWNRPLAAHHDVDVAPDGRVLTLDYEMRVIPELQPEIPVRDNGVVVLDGDGRELERVSLWDLLHTAPDLFTMIPGKARNFEGGNEIDLLHANTVEWMHRPELAVKSPIYGPEALLVCVRNQDTIAIFDWKAKKLIWAWGQGVISGPHDATVLADGHILVFDNGLDRGWSRVVELDPIRREIVWQWRGDGSRPFYTSTRGSNQRLANGNTLIVESDAGRAYEVTPDGSVVWEFLNSNLTDKREPSVIVRMRRFDGIDYETLAERVRSGAGLPFRVD